MNKYRERILSMGKKTGARLVIPENHDQRIQKASQELVSMGFQVLNHEDYKENTASYLDYIHTQDEVVCVLSGTADVSVSGQAGKVLPGDRLDVPKNTYHSIIVTSDQPLVVLTGMRP